jgi:uncharacterized membrane-anchored protein
MFELKTPLNGKVTINYDISRDCWYIFLANEKIYTTENKNYQIKEVLNSVFNNLKQKSKNIPTQTDSIMSLNPKRVILEF